MRVKIGERLVGPAYPCYVVAEIGANHNGDLQTALRMIRAAQHAGADAVKFQKRTLELAIPEAQRGVPRDTPWGTMAYIDYRRRLEFERDAFDQIDLECKNLGMTWFASAFDVPSLEFLTKYDLPAYKIPSACITDEALLTQAACIGAPIIMSTGMSTAQEISYAVDNILDEQDDHCGGEPGLVLLHCKSAYPTHPNALNLRAIRTLMGLYGEEVVVGYSGHEVGLWTTLCAVVLGASLVERHFTLSRAMWGTDQAASVEPKGFSQLVQQIARWEEAKGSGEIFVHESEQGPRNRLRNLKVPGQRRLL